MEREYHDWLYDQVKTKIKDHKQIHGQVRVVKYIQLGQEALCELLKTICHELFLFSYSILVSCRDTDGFFVWTIEFFS